MSGIAPKQKAFKFKIAPHKQKYIVNCNDELFFSIIWGSNAITLGYLTNNKIKSKYYHTSQTNPKSNPNIIEAETKSSPLAHIYMVMHSSKFKWRLAALN